MRHRTGPKLGQQVAARHAEAISTAVLVRQAYRVKKSGQHSVSDITWTRDLASKSIRLALPLRG